MDFRSMTTGQLVEYFNGLSVKPYDPVFTDDPKPLPPIGDILEMNRDVEPFLLQASAFPTPLRHRRQFSPLTFVHFSDIHAVLELWDRIMAYISFYRQEIAFGLHTGDYCGDNQQQYRDLYAEGIGCPRPILNCVGNHDTISGPLWERQPRAEAWKRLFQHTGDWGVTFLDCPCSMSYYKDFPEANLRLIVLDQYHELFRQAAWLEELLEEAKERGLWVITAMHEPTAAVTEPVDVTFHTAVDYEPDPESVFDEVLGRFLAEGGSFVCNLCGHLHHDAFGYSSRGVLNVAVECACDWAGWTDGRRVRGTKTYDCFNVVSVDTELGLLKLVRVGDNCDCFLRSKRALCYDYRWKKVISNG